MYLLPPPAGDRPAPGRAGQRDGRSDPVLSRHAAPDRPVRANLYGKEKILPWISTLVNYSITDTRSWS